MSISRHRGFRELRPILFQIGPVPIRAYGVMLCVALVVGIIRTTRAAKCTVIKGEQVWDIAIYGLLAGLLFAHLTSLILDLPYYSRHLSEIVSLWSGVFSPSGGLRGLSFHGGLVGAILAGIFYTRRKGINFWVMADLCAPALALGYGIARIGCFLNGCCAGTPTHLLWGIRFHLGPTSSDLTSPSHPTQLYASIAGVLMYFVLVMVERRRHFAGQVFVVYLALYSFYRFFIEFLRKGVSAEVAFLGFTEAQVVSILLLLVVPVLWRRLCCLPSRR